MRADQRPRGTRVVAAPLDEATEDVQKMEDMTSYGTKYSEVCCRVTSDLNSSSLLWVGSLPEVVQISNVLLKGALFRHTYRRTAEKRGFVMCNQISQTMKEPPRRLRYNVAISLDGFIAPSDERTDWIVHDENIHFDALYAQFDTFVMGRKTYECMFSMGDQNPPRKYPKENLIVLSKTLKRESNPGVTLVSEDCIGFLADLKNVEGRDIWLMGGGQLAGPCLDAGILDLVETAIMPVMLRKGTKMADELTLMLTPPGGFKLDLVYCRQMATSGIIMCKYNVRRQTAASLGVAMLFS